MGGWQALIGAATCGAGVIAFLKPVANETERTEANLRRLERAERKALQKRLQMAGQETTVSPAAAA
jgi:hypothetical protein